MLTFISDVILGKPKDGSIITLCAMSGVDVVGLGITVSEELKRIGVSSTVTHTLNISNADRLEDVSAKAKKNGTVVVNILPEKTYIEYVLQGSPVRDFSDITYFVVQGSTINMEYTFVKIPCSEEISSSMISPMKVSF